jgi:hypothetical protein
MGSSHCEVQMRCEHRHLDQVGFSNHETTYFPLAVALTPAVVQVNLLINESSARSAKLLK